MVTSNSTGKSRPSCFQQAKEHDTIALHPLIVAMPPNKCQAPFELSLISLALLFPRTLKPTLPLPGWPWLGRYQTCPCGMGRRRGMRAGKRGWCIPAACRNGATYITPSLGNEVKLHQLFCRRFRGSKAAACLKGKSGMCFSRGGVGGGVHMHIVVCTVLKRGSKLQLRGGYRWWYLEQARPLCTVSTLPEIALFRILLL